MITLTEIKIDLFQKLAEVDAIGHGVNCVGSMGAGIAVRFRHEYPLLYKEYRRECYANNITPGCCWAWFDSVNNKWIYNLAVKNHYKPPSKLSWIKSSFKKMLEHMISNEVSSCAIPLIGCGLGRLDWDTEVKPSLEEIAASFKENNIKIIVCKL